MFCGFLHQNVNKYYIANTGNKKKSLKQTSIISGNQAEEDLHMYHLEALYNLHANETGFYLKKNY